MVLVCSRGGVGGASALCDVSTSVIQNICKEAQQDSPTVSCVTGKQDDLRMIAKTVTEAQTLRHARHMLVDDLMLTIC